MDDTSCVHTTDIDHLQQIARVIPETTSLSWLHELLARYGNECDPQTAALPAQYRVAVALRLRTLLIHAVVRGAA